MAIGDAASSAGYLLVPNEGSEDAKVRYGAVEINRTRDYIAVVRGLIPATRSAYRTNSGIRSGTSAPSGGADGDVYFQVI